MISKTKIKILIDTREKAPLLFDNYDVDIHRDVISAGDYTLLAHDLPGDDHSVMIERKKNCMELIGNLGKNFDRFKAECEQLCKYKHRLIVVCGNENFSYLYRSGLTKVNPSYAYKQLAELYADYGIPTYFFSDREAAENFMFRLFCKVLKDAKEE